MVTPDQIKKKIENRYLPFLKAWLAGDELFPYDIRCNKKVPDDMGAAQQEAAQLKAHSKARRGCGYSVEWQEKNFRRHGRNRWPKRIYLANQSDFLRYLGKQHEFDAFARAVELVRQRFPQLEDWLRKHPKRLMNVADEIDQLLTIAQYLVDNPRPDCFLRELPVGADTKFLERRGRQAVLYDRLDLLTPSAVSHHEQRFERRFGLRYKGDYLNVRFLDPALVTIRILALSKNGKSSTFFGVA